MPGSYKTNLGTGFVFSTKDKGEFKASGLKVGSINIYSDNTGPFSNPLFGETLTVGDSYWEWKPVLENGVQTEAYQIVSIPAVSATEEKPKSLDLKQLKEEMKDILSPAEEDEATSKLADILSILEGRNKPALDFWQKQKDRLVALAEKYSVEALLVTPPGKHSGKDVIREISELMLCIAAKIPQATPDLVELREKLEAFARDILIKQDVDLLVLQKFLLYLTGFDFGNQLTAVWSAFLSQSLMHREFEATYEETLKRAIDCAHRNAYDEAYSRAKSEVHREIQSESKKLLDQWKKEELDRMYEEMWNKMMASKDKGLKEAIISSLLGEE